MENFFSLEEEALNASGLKEDKEIAHYMARMMHLQQQFVGFGRRSDDAFAEAQDLFDYLWESKPFRYQSGGNYRLNEVIDAQLNDESRAVGNCLGLTILYNCLLRRLGIFATTLYLINISDAEQHVLTVLRTTERLVYVENIRAEGFDYRLHRDTDRGIYWADRELIADIYHSVGNELFIKGEFPEALKNYDMAIRLNPEYERAHLNKLILLDAMQGSKVKPE